MRHILYLERRRAIAKALLPSLHQHYVVTMLGTRRDALQHLERHLPDIVLIDVAAMKFNVQRFCDDLRKIAPSLPIFLLLSETIKELPCAANGSLRQPFTPRKLLYWLNRALSQPEGQLPEWHGLQLDPQRGLLLWQEQQVPLTPKRAALMQAFFKIPEETWPRGRLMSEVWGTTYTGDTRTLEVHIYWLRRALRQLDAPFKIETRRGIGYRFVHLAEAAAPEDSDWDSRPTTEA